MSQRLATAEWADPEIYANEHAYKDGKFWLGRSPLNGQPLGYVDDRHICLVSGTRAGKGTTSIINNLCLWPGSVVVVDPKGENATVTAARRGKGSEHCEGMGQAVHVLDPFNAAQVDDSLRSRFNPLDALDPNDPITIDEAGRVADAIVVMNPESKDPFWDQSARTLVKGLILHVLTAPQFEGRRNLVTIRRLIARGDHEGIATLKEMGETDLPSAQALLWEGVAQNNTFNGVVAGIGDSMVNMAVNASKQFESVLQVANRNTEFLDSPGMQACLETSDFKLSDLKTDPKGVSVYLSLPQRFMGEHFRWLRMMITLTMTEMEAIKGQPATGHRVLMCLDEFAGLKRMEVIENAVAQIAGYGVKLFFVLQSLEQLKATYKDNWETFLSNAGLKIFFGIDDHFTRDYVSKFIGETELLRELGTSTNTVNQQTTQSTGSSSSSSWNQQESTGVSFSDNWKAMPFFLRNTAGLFAAISGKRQASRSSNTNTAKSDGGSDGTQSTEATASGTATAEGKNESLHKRPLITPDEIGLFFGRIDNNDDHLYPGLGLVLLTGQKPGVVHRTNYYDDFQFNKCFDNHLDHNGCKMIEIEAWLPPNEIIGYLAPSWNHVSGWVKAMPGSSVKIGQVLFVFDTSISGLDNDVHPATLAITSPVDGVVKGYGKDGDWLKPGYDDGRFSFDKRRVSDYCSKLSPRIVSLDLDGPSNSVVGSNALRVKSHCEQQHKAVMGIWAKEIKVVLCCFFLLVFIAMIILVAGMFLPRLGTIFVSLLVGLIVCASLAFVIFRASCWLEQVRKYPKDALDKVD